MKLNALQVETAKPIDKTYKIADGGGLYLEITPKGAKYWRMKYRRPTDKKEDRLAFGIWPTVTLAHARAKRDEAKKLLVQGIDPQAEQKEAQAENSGHTLSKRLLARSSVSRALYLPVYRFIRHSPAQNQPPISPD